MAVGLTVLAGVMRRGRQAASAAHTVAQVGGRLALIALWPAQARRQVRERNPMTSWSEVATAAPEFAERVRRLFDARKHKTLATLRRDGSPRISGIEAEFAEGELWLGMMPGSLKAADLLRDPRLALHSPTQDPPHDDPSAWPGEAKIAGRAIEVAGPERSGQTSHRFRVDVTEVVLTRVGEPSDHLVIESWHQGRGLQRRER